MLQQLKITQPRYRSSGVVGRPRRWSDHQVYFVPKAYSPLEQPSFPRCPGMCNSWNEGRTFLRLFDVGAKLVLISAERFRMMFGFAQFAQFTGKHLGSHDRQ